MDLLFFSPIILIVAGAIIMAVNIVRSITVFRVFHEVVRENTEKVKMVFRLHKILMLFFLTGYVVVAFATITEIDIVSNFVVGMIFFFGAVFVYLGIVLQTKMFMALKNLYDHSLTISNTLAEEKENLKKTNENLAMEFRCRKAAQEEQKRLETRLIRSEKMEALGLLAGGVAHDLNNVLSGIVSYPELLLSDEELEK